MSGLWTPGTFFPKFRASKKVVTLKDGRRAEVSVDDSGTVTQIETDDQLDAIVRPRSVTVKIRKS